MGLDQELELVNNEYGGILDDELEEEVPLAEKPSQVKVRGDIINDLTLLMACGYR